MDLSIVTDAICKQANEIWKFVRDSDGKEYYITFHSHWSEIKPIDNSNETYTVKWLGGTGKYGGEAYISHEGASFSKLRRDNQ